MPPLIAVYSLTHDEEIWEIISNSLEVGGPKMMKGYREEIRTLAVYEVAYTIMAFTEAAWLSKDQEKARPYAEWATKLWDLVFKNGRYDSTRGCYDYPESTDYFIGAHVWPRFLFDGFGKTF